MTVLLWSNRAAEKTLLGKKKSKGGRQRRERRQWKDGRGQEGHRLGLVVVNRGWLNQSSFCLFGNCTVGACWSKIHVGVAYIPTVILLSLQTQRLTTSLHHFQVLKGYIKVPCLSCKQT